MKLITTLCIVFLSFGALQSETLLLGIVPQQSATKLAEDWGPIAKFLSDQSGLDIQFSTAKDIPTFEKRLSEGFYQIAYMNPYHYVVYSEKTGYKAIAKEKDKRIKGIIVVKKDSPIQLLEELKAQNIAFPAPAAFAATILPRAALKNMNIPITPHYVSSHDSVYKGVARGVFPAGGAIIRTFKALEPELQNQLRILWETQAYTPHAFAIHPDIDSVTAEKVQLAFLALNESEEGQQLLIPLQINALEKARNEDWDDVRALHLDQLNQE